MRPWSPILILAVSLLCAYGIRGCSLVVYFGKRSYGWFWNLNSCGIDAVHITSNFRRWDSFAPTGTGGSLLRRLILHLYIGGALLCPGFVRGRCIDQYPISSVQDMQFSFQFKKECFSVSLSASLDRVNMNYCSDRLALEYILTTLLSMPSGCMAHAKRTMYATPATLLLSRTTMIDCFRKSQITPPRNWCYAIYSINVVQRVLIEVCRGRGESLLKSKSLLVGQQ